ncbi:hypothetical protein V9T40_011567 [Parthenolecanium corni]|uniref:Mitochondrial assembly of ribosomal large subunit protein 1 n=1 Tax=Parthenolecanium corni TaxID=536013 RepID=A0AAN9XYA2_9HEMI
MSLDVNVTPGVKCIDGCPTPSGGGSPDIIPIVVGCALAILVVVVLVAYLINRRRSQAHGYLSIDEDAEKSQDTKIASGGLRNYKVFEDFDSPVILDIDEERRLLEENPEYLQEMQKRERGDRFFGMNLSRGETGVFDIEELIQVLQNENASNIVTIAVPREFRYVDYMVIVTGRSNKHLFVMAEYVRKLFKMKRSESDKIPKIEGLGWGATKNPSSPAEWLALDLGNIALHLFLEPVREKYDLETLWSVGKEFDDLCNMKEDDYISLLKKHTWSSLEDLVPLDESSTEENKNLG